MKIIKKKTKHLREGDILIIDFKEITVYEHPVSFHGSRARLNTLHKKFEGESEIFLFEIDEIEHEFLDEEKEKGTKYTFYHITDILSSYTNTKALPDIKINDGNYIWNVIKNPHGLKHYKEA